jgi:hypothetical protein
MYFQVLVAARHNDIMRNYADCYEIYGKLIYGEKANLSQSRKVFFFISLLMPSLVGHRSSDWWLLTTANTAGTNGLTCLNEELEVNNF